MVAVELHGELTPCGMLGLKGRHLGKGKPFIEGKSGQELYAETNEWRHVQSTIDRDNDVYRELITDPKTGRVIKKVEELLSQHWGHGSAKRRKSAEVQADTNKAPNQSDG